MSSVMSRKQARQSAAKDRHMAEIKQAYADGKTIQYRDPDGKWRDLPFCAFDSDYERYRIKTDPPTEIFIPVFDDGSLGNWQRDELAALMDLWGCQGNEVLKFVLVKAR